MEGEAFKTLASEQKRAQYTVLPSMQIRLLQPASRLLLTPELSQAIFYETGLVLDQTNIIHVQNIYY